MTRNPLTTPPSDTEFIACCLTIIVVSLVIGDRLSELTPLGEAALVITSLLLVGVSVVSTSRKLLRQYSVGVVRR